MREIPLSRGLFAQVDDYDFEWLSKWKWYAIDSHKHGKCNWYAVRSVNYTREDGKRWCKRVYMHKELMYSPSFQVDHKDRNTLNNCRSNLRPASPSQNMRNRDKGSRNTSGYLGVSVMDGRRKKYRAKIRNGESELYLGDYYTAEEAALVRDRKAIEVHGEFAVLNFPNLLKTEDLSLELMTS